MKEKGSAIDFNFLRPREPEEMLSEGYDTVAIADFCLPPSRAATDKASVSTRAADGRHLALRPPQSPTLSAQTPR